MAVNKVIYGGETLVDLTGDSVTPETLAEGATAHDASGQKITGKMVPGGGSSVQSDWNQTDSSAADFIKNKPLVVLSLDFETLGLPKTAREIEELQVSGVCVLFSITGTPITCTYDEAQNPVGCSVTDIKAVSFENGTMIFQGVLYQFDADGLMVSSLTGTWSGTVL